MDIRLAQPHELRRVAELQLDIFAPASDPPALLPLLASLYDSNQRKAREGMTCRLISELEHRMMKGSDVFIATDPTVNASDSAVDPTGLYVEPGAPLLGCVDLSSQELVLPTHGLAGGLYLSCMAVSPQARRRGVARSLIAACESRAAERNEHRLWLHVEQGNRAAIELYEAEGYLLQPESALHRGFARALNLQETALLYAKEL